MINPIIGLWELDDVSLDAQGSEFDYLDETGENNLVGESEFTLELMADLNFERILKDVSFTDGSVRDIEEEGEWELDGDDLDLDLDGTELTGLPYRFTVTENTATELVLSYTDRGSFYPESKIQEWLADGTVDAQGFFTVTDEEIDSIQLNFLQSVDLNFTLEFDRP